MFHYAIYLRERNGKSKMICYEREKDAFSDVKFHLYNSEFVQVLQLQGDNLLGSKILAQSKEKRILKRVQ